MGLLRNLRRWWRRRHERCPPGTGPISTPHQWLREPETQAGDDVVLFVAVCHDNTIAPHTTAYINALASHQWRVIVTLVTPDIRRIPDTRALDAASGIMLRENEGFDFAAWATLLTMQPDLWLAKRLLFANDSLFGPFGDFATTMQALRAAGDDVVSLTLSHQIKPHFQSFFFMLQRNALCASVMRDFWRNVKNLPQKWDVSRWYEVELLAITERAGLSFKVLFPLAATRHAQKLNPSIHQWRELVVSGFPFVKVSALRDAHAEVDLTNWRELLKEHHADVAGIEAHLLRVAPEAPALKADSQP